MSTKCFRWCIVPYCKNTSFRTPTKLFIVVPKQPEMRKTWIQLTGRDPAEISSLSVIYICEDHFDVSYVKLLSNIILEYYHIDDTKIKFSNFSCQMIWRIICNIKLWDLLKKSA